MLENQARKAERRMKRTIKKSATADSINLMEAFAEFIEEKEAQNKSAATIHNYKQSFEKYCAFNEFDDNTGIEEADQKAFLHWVNTMAQDLTPTTVNHYLRDVRTFLNWCMDEDRAYIEKRFKMKELSVQDTKPKAFSDDDIALLMEKPNRKADFAEWRTYVIVCWIMDNGARAQTVCCVKMEDIDLKKKTITYAHTKNKKAQVVGMSDTLKTILKEYIRKWRYGATEEDYLFPNIGDEQLTTKALNRYTMELAKEQVKLAFAQAQKEVDDLHQRTKEGIQTARLEGKQIGGVKGAKLNVKKASPAKELIRKHNKDFGGSLNDVDTMKLVGVARNTYYKYKKEVKEELLKELES